MRKTELQQRLSRLDPLDEPSPDLEQYATPPDIAADVLNRMQVAGDLGRVADLGCGNGILAIGAALLGADAVGVDVDPDAVERARENARDAEVADRTEFRETDVRTVELDADVAVMNPPFGLQRRDANLDFLDAAFGTAPVVYALLHASEDSRDRTRRFIKNYASNHGYAARVQATYRFPLPRRFGFHEQDRRDVDVDLYRFERT